MQFSLIVEFLNKQGPIKYAYIFKVYYLTLNYINSVGLFGGGLLENGRFQRKILEEKKIKLWHLYTYVFM